MGKTKIIDEKKLFVESKKAIQIAIEREKILGKKMRTTDKLELVRDHKVKTKSPDEYEALETLEKELERKLRFNQLNESAVPEEHKEKVKRNAAVELQEVNELLNESILQLKSRYEYLEDEVIPLITNIEKLERLAVIPVQIKAVVDGEIGENTVFSMQHIIRQQNYSKYAEIAKNINAQLNKAIKDMKRLEFSIDFKKIKEGEE